MSSQRFEGPPPCRKLHCEWLYSNSRQIAQELDALKLRNKDVLEQLAVAEEAKRTADLRRQDAYSKMAKIKRVGWLQSPPPFVCGT